MDVRCANGFIPFDRRQNMSVICEYNESSQAYEWNTNSYSRCIENNCGPPKDFKWLEENMRRDSYAIGQEVTYTCPSGNELRTICVIDPNTGFGVWDFAGSCSGRMRYT